jgi:ATP-dependent protease HslVU (ClpYQ) peptidase subunit
VEPKTRIALHSQTKRKIFEADKLFSVVGSTAERIITLLKNLELHSGTYYEELKRQCYDGTKFENQLDEIVYVLHERGSRLLNQLDALLRFDYNLYVVHNLQQRSDHEEVELYNLNIYTTPESLLTTLAR